jgi:RND family efflux transporter MFP subunit
VKACSRIAALCVCLAGCHKAEEAEAPPLAVSVARAERGDVSEVVEVAGELSALPGLDVKLGPLVPGRLGAVLVAEGDAVREGQLLARLESTPLRDAVAQAEAQLAQARAQAVNAQAKLSRAQRALDAGVAAAQEVEDDQLAVAQAQAAVKSAAAAVSTARNQLGRSELRAPFAGVVAHVFAAAGEPVDANKPVVEVARVEQVELRAPLAPLLAARVRAGQQAGLRVDALPQREFPARVIAVAPTVDPATGAALVRLRAENPQGALRLGSFAHARIVVEVRRGVLRVPEAALLADESGAAVEVVDKDAARRVAVKVAARDGRWAGIEQGLDEGVQVIVQGNYALPDGTRVKPQEAAASSETAALSTDAGERE